MNLQVSFRNTRARDEVKRRAEVLFGKLERFLDASTDSTLEIAREHGAFVVEITVHAHGEVYQTSEEDEDLRTALDRTFHTAETTLRRAKEKRVDRWQDGPPKQDGFVPVGDDEDDDDDA